MATLVNINNVRMGGILLHGDRESSWIILDLKSFLAFKPHRMKQRQGGSQVSSVPGVYFVPLGLLFQAMPVKQEILWSKKLFKCRPCLSDRATRGTDLRHPVVCSFLRIHQAPGEIDRETREKKKKPLQVRVGKNNNKVDQDRLSWI